MPRPLWLLMVALLAAGPVVACGPSQPAQSALEYAENARKAYAEALDSFFDRDWDTAKTLFTDLKRKYGYSRYARLAELRLADIDYRQEKFAESISGYKGFVHDYPNDPEVPYARYKIARALFEESSPSLLLGPLEERDLAAVADAHATLKDFIDDYPDYKLAPEMAYMLEVVTGVLARHELYVARFYRDDGVFDAAVKRVQFCLREYPGSGLEPEAMVLLGETYMMMKQRAKARSVLSRMLVEYPDSPFVKPARGFLAMLGGADPTVKPRPEADRARAAAPSDADAEPQPEPQPEPARAD